jgi:protein-tyrosine phosphatase
VTERADELAQALGRVDAAWAGVRELAAAEFPDLRLERGFEVMLDTPRPDFSDARVRLAGTRFVLVEFPFMAVPPNVQQAVFDLKMAGWAPVVAHPERYTGLDAALAGPEEWRRVGAYLQVNAGSLLGKYGPEAERAAWGLLRRGWADYVCSDYHARGTVHLAAARARLEAAGGAEQAALLFEANAARLLAGEPPLPVHPLEAGGGRAPLWKRILGRG